MSYTIGWIARLKKAKKGVASYDIARARRMQSENSRFLNETSFRKELSNKRERRGLKRLSTCRKRN